MTDRQVSFLAFYDTTKAEVYGFVLARCGDHHVAEEVLAETYLAAVRSNQRDGLTVGWLITVARRRLVDYWRRQGAARSTTQRLLSDRTLSPGPEQDADDLILDALASLPVRQRAVVAMRYLDEHSVSEIADELGVTYKTAESLLSRGRASLRRAYEELSHEPR